MGSIVQLPNLESKVGIYRNALDNQGCSHGITVKEIVSKISGQELEHITGELRKLSGTKFDKYKKMFPAVAWSGLFSPTRSKATLISHSGLICLDFDGLTGGDLASARERIQEDPMTFICFTSPSGKGIKVVVRVELQAPTQHNSFFSQLVAYFKDTLNLTVDQSCRNVDRLCFLPHDPFIFVNPNSLILKPDKPCNEPPPRKSSNLSQEGNFADYANDAEVFGWCLMVHNRSHTFTKGQRNHYLTSFVNFCNDYGVSKEYCESQCICRFNEIDFTEKEIMSTIKSVYMKTHQHGYKQYIPNPKDINVGLIRSSDYLETENDQSGEVSPMIPHYIYNNLPKLLLRMCEAFSTDRERDTLLTSALVVLSGCFPTVSGIYNGVRVYPNLYGFIVAPAASGKGAMAWAKRIALGHHRRLMNERSGSRVNHNPIGLGKEVTGQEAHGFPSMLFFPANSSGASVINALDANNGMGIIFESEADTLSATLGQDWGNYSDMLRKAFHHETVSYMRMRENQVIEIEMPKLSVCLSGTPAQVQRLIPNAEDGLFSRFLFYGFSAQPEWRSVSPSVGKVNLDDFFDVLQDEVTGLIASIEDSVPVNFTLAEHQWRELDDTFDDWLKEVYHNIGGNAVSSVKRLGLITFRIAMLLSVIRQAKPDNLHGEIVCTDIDFRIAMDLAATYLQHSLTTYGNLPQEKGSNHIGQKISEKEEKFREAMHLKEMGLSNRRIADRLDVSEATIRNWLKVSA